MYQVFLIPFEYYKITFLGSSISTKIKNDYKTYSKQ